MLATPQEDFKPTDRGYAAAPEELLRNWLEGFSAYDGPDTSVLEKKGEFKIPIEGISGKEGAKNVPSWARGERPYVGENGKEFAKRLCDAKYGAENYNTGPKEAYNQIKKWGDRSFKDPK